MSIDRSRPAAAEPVAIGSTGELLRLVGDPMRAAILQMLSGEQLCTCHLQEALGAKQTLVSHHLRLLREAGLVVGEPHGRFTYYRLAPHAFDSARDALAGLADAANRGLTRRPC